MNSDEREIRGVPADEKDGEEAELWFRVTAGFRPDAGRWRITHVHDFVPFAVDRSAKALLDLKPPDL